MSGPPDERVGVPPSALATLLGGLLVRWIDGSGAEAALAAEPGVALLNRGAVPDHRRQGP
jgi:hypothetical protein